MTWMDLWKLAARNLQQRKLRVSLNLVGIVLGCTLVLMTAAGTAGVETAFQVLFDSSEFAREIEVRPSYGSHRQPPESEIQVSERIPPARRQRLREELTKAWQNENRTEFDYRIQPSQMDDLARIPHVIRVVPDFYLGCTVDTSTWMRAQDDLSETAVVALDVEQSVAERRLVAGRLAATESRQQDLMISELLAYQMGFATDAELQQVLGQPLTIRFRAQSGKMHSLNWLVSEQGVDYDLQTQLAGSIDKLVDNLDATELSEAEQMLIRRFAEAVLPSGGTQDVYQSRSFTICGVLRSEGKDMNLSSMFREFIGATDADLMIHHLAARELLRAQPDNTSLYGVKVVVDSTRNLRAAEESIKQLDLNAHSALWAWDRIEHQIQTVGTVIYALAAAVLLMAAVGISNTLFISVVQRTKEFGILKSVGMKDRDVLRLMLCEGVLLGAAGALLATLLSMLLAVCGRGLLSMYVNYRANTDVQGVFFELGPLSIAATWAFAIAVSTLASALPAWRASRLDPVVAMRQE